MGNILADQIERFIMERFLAAREQEIILQRKELANELQCAPSQISYVLSTRFSGDQGFIVESKRGLGGFIRITIIDSDKRKEMQSRQQLRRLSLADIDKFLYISLQEGRITNREAQLLHEVFDVIYRELDSDKQARLVQHIYGRIKNVFFGGKDEVSEVQEE